MNCREGDFARSVISSGCLHGKFVTVLRLAKPEDEDKNGCYWPAGDPMGPAWHVQFHNVPERYSECLFYDKYLRPIRDPGEDAQDETLSWLPAPHKEPA